jgi:Fe-Mn family superoxide dismutase
MKDISYTLPDLVYGYKDLEPYISERQLIIHHQKHHQAYIDGANTIFRNLEQARNQRTELDMKSTLKSLSWNIGGHVLHSLFWKNIRPASKKENKPEGKLAEAIEKEFKSFEKLKQEFIQTAMSIEGSGWAALVYCQKYDKLLLMQIEKHNTNIYPEFKILMILDMFEHAYYIDYRNEKAKFVDGFWNIVNWEEANRRFKRS